MKVSLLIWLFVGLALILSCSISAPDSPLTSAPIKEPTTASIPNPDKLGTIERDVTYCIVDGLFLKMVLS